MPGLGFSDDLLKSGRETLDNNGTDTKLEICNTVPFPGSNYRPPPYRRIELFNDWGRRGYDDSVPGEVTKTPSSGDRTT